VHWFDILPPFLDQGVTQVLVKMGENGSVLVCDQEPPVFQPAIRAPTVVDTTGAGDTFTAAYAVALIERQTPAEALRFAGTFPTLVFASHLNNDVLTLNTCQYAVK